VNTICALVPEKVGKSVFIRSRARWDSEPGIEKVLSSLPVPPKAVMQTTAAATSANHRASMRRRRRKARRPRR
jgi:hypothetical protein